MSRGRSTQKKGHRPLETPPVRNQTKIKKAGSEPKSTTKSEAKTEPRSKPKSKAKTGAAGAPADPPPAIDPVPASTPPGQRLYDLPYGSPAPPLVNREIGLDNLFARAGHNAGYDIDLTLLDAADHRLIRSGVLLAHRVLDGRGEWYLGAPDWVPLLPKELIESMSHADLSEQLTDLIRPFRRRAPLSPVAALHCERREFALRSAAGTIGLLRDDKVTVRRGGLTIARYREVVLTPVGTGLNQVQADWLDRCLQESGATVLPRFPRLVRRLGAPATGPTDFPEPAPFDPQAPFSAFVSSLVALRLRQLLTADLRIRGAEPPAAIELTRAARTLSQELDGLRQALDDGWVGDLVDELDWLAGLPVDTDETSPQLTGHLVGGLRGERYLSLLDRLVAARGARIGDVALEPADVVLDGLAADQLARLTRSCERLAVDGPARAWADAWQEYERTSLVNAAIGHLHPAQVEQRHRRLGRSRPLLAEVQRLDDAADELLARSDHGSPTDAFALGREYERNRDVTKTARSAFLISWARTRRKLGL